MKKIIKIAYLYYDLMNLYGEVGNIRALERFIKRQGVDTLVDKLSIGDKIDFKKYDFYYIGCGSEENIAVVLDDIMKYKSEIKKAVESGKFILATGNAMELFGKKIRLNDSRIIDCLDLMNYSSFHENKRIVGEAVYHYSSLPDEFNTIVGFKNTQAKITHNDQRLFDATNSAKYNNLYTMNFVGPLLIRNPYFTNLLIEELFKEKGYDFTPIVDTVEFEEYHEFVKLFINRNDLD